MTTLGTSTKPTKTQFVFNLMLAVIMALGLLLVQPAGTVQAADLLNTSFTSGTDGFTYTDDTFGTSKAAYASGSRLTTTACYGGSGGCLNVRLGGVDATTVTNMSGGWVYTFNLATAQTGVSLNLRYRLAMPSAYIYDEYSRVQVSLDGTLYGRGSKNYVDHTGGDANFAHDTDWLQVSIYFGDLSAGSHTLILGGFSNKKTNSTKITDIYFDDVVLSTDNATPVTSSTQTLVNRLNLSNFKTNIQSVASFGDRCRNSTSCAPYTSFTNAQNWVAQQLQVMGYTTYKHNYTYSGWTGSNLYATKIGTVHPDQMYIVSGHLDGRGGGGAADDDGSAVSLMLEMARVLASADVQTDVSVRFIFWDQEEIGLYGSKAYVADRRSLQGTTSEPTWLGNIQHDMILYDHGVGTAGANQSVYADMDVEWRDGTTYATQSKALAQKWRFASGQYAVTYPANSANYSTNTDDTPFQPYTAAISVRENRRNLSGEWINPYYHKSTDIYNNYSEADFALGFNTLQTTLGLVADLAGAQIVSANTAPVANAQSVSTNEDTAKAITLSGSDADGDPLTYRVTGSPSHGALSGTAPALTYTPAVNYNGSDSFTFVVNDGKVDSTAATVSITVSAVNDAPTASPQSITTSEDTAKAITLSGSDVDGNPLTYSVTSGPSHGALSGTPPALTYTPAADYFGADSFTFVVNDGSVNSAAATVSITVSSVNDAPSATAQSVSTNEDTPKEITLAGSDPEGSALTYRVTVSPAHGTLSGSAPALTYTPAANYNGSDAFTFVVNDGSVDSAPAVVSISVVAINDAPVAVAQSIATDMDVPVAITLGGSDPEGDALTYQVTVDPLHGVLSGTAPALTYTPASGYTGDDSFSFVVNDGSVDSAAAIVSISVTLANTGPVANQQSVSVDEDLPLGITLTGSDAEGNPLTYTVLSNPAHGVLSGTAPDLIYTPAANFNGEDSFLFKVNDGRLDSDPNVVLITVNPVNDVPVANIKSVITDQDTPIFISLTGSDVDGDALTFSITTAPLEGSLSGTPPSVTYTPASGYAGPDSFQFVVNDGSVDSDPASVSIIVQAAANTVVFSDDFETSQGWVVNPNGTDTATSTTSGKWVVANPQGTTYLGAKQLDITTSGSNDLVTGYLAGTTVNSYDLDGSSTVRSPLIDLPAGQDLTLSFQYYFARGSNATSLDYFRVKVIGTTTSTVLQIKAAKKDVDAVWQLFQVNLNSFAGQSVYIQIEAGDMGVNGLVEAAVDDVVITAEASSSSLISTGFDSDEGGFSYLDDAFGTSQPEYASGSFLPAGGIEDGGLQVLLGGLDEEVIQDMSAGWTTTFTLSEPSNVALSFWYKLTQSADYESEEFSQLLMSVNGTLVGSGANSFVAQLVGNGNGGDIETTGWQFYSVNLESLAAGEHVLAIGGYNNQKTYNNERTEILIDQVTVIKL